MGASCNCRSQPAAVNALTLIHKHRNSVVGKTKIAAKGCGSYKEKPPAITTTDDPSWESEMVQTHSEVGAATLCGDLVSAHPAGFSFVYKSQVTARGYNKRPLILTVAAGVDRGSPEPGRGLPASGGSPRLHSASLHLRLRGRIQSVPGRVIPPPRPAPPAAG